MFVQNQFQESDEDDHNTQNLMHMHQIESTYKEQVKSTRELNIANDVVRDQSDQIWLELRQYHYR